MAKWHSTTRSTKSCRSSTSVIELRRKTGARRKLTRIRRYPSTIRCLTEATRVWGSRRMYMDLLAATRSPDLPLWSTKPPKKPAKAKVPTTTLVTSTLAAKTSIPLFTSIRSLWKPAILANSKKSLIKYCFSSRIRDFRLPFRLNSQPITSISPWPWEEDRRQYLTPFDPQRMSMSSKRKRTPLCPNLRL